MKVTVGTTPTQLPGPDTGLLRIYSIVGNADIFIARTAADCTATDAYLLRADRDMVFDVGALEVNAADNLQFKKGQFLMSRPWVAVASGTADLRVY